ncbi:hypothetical protein [Deinococcus cellulosilyticus]|uniref:hypothetical protein n=1 Tax=Deinococcus cellulosilyticus TaxID=401558 RepID=UPI0011BF969B|nr:hypothetical protein [Deinococcus cellulosilyticus]
MSPTNVQQLEFSNWLLEPLQAFFENVQTFFGVRHEARNLLQSTSAEWSWWLLGVLMIVFFFVARRAHNLLRD